MAGRRRYVRRRRPWNYGDGTIYMRIGSRRSPRYFQEILVSGPEDAPRLARVVDDQTRAYPKDPLVISVNGYQPWLEDIFSACIEGYWTDISDLAREVRKLCVEKYVLCIGDADDAMSFPGRCNLPIRCSFPNVLRSVVKMPLGHSSSTT